MEQQKLPNVTLAIVLGVISFFCCCFAGLPGAIIAGIALLLVNKDAKKYTLNPELYSNYSQLKTAKIIAIIGIVLGVLYFIYTYYTISQMGGWDGYMEKVQEIMEQYGIEE
ncbi:CCC motif membrane protein [Arenibacter sp. GZD96]|uniref:CCC motif membrane protein n=1 Tax=Aurantibrevibacter litoralis TaxID=3106030 RepID=UPI002B001C8C|nr:CCC motif membrane protein [Arenibacter sp. GZD-96]MEA1785947.1 CCC motif membrane protein [Arenibacter sp. GZD-96]